MSRVRAAIVVYVRNPNPGSQSQFQIHLKGLFGSRVNLQS